MALVLLIFVVSSPAYAKKWNVYPTMARGVIQAVIDAAKDGDVIYFNPGTYDFSTAPTNRNYENGGALQIVDKSLTIKGAPGSIIVGAPVIAGSTSIWMTGINAFWILNSDADKDVAFDGLTFKTFMNGIFAVNSNGNRNYNVGYPNLRNLQIKSCTFTDIYRNGIAVEGEQGNLTITDNNIEGLSTISRLGLYIDWLNEPGNTQWQPDNTLVTIKNNSIQNFLGGIIFQQASNVEIKNNNISTDSNPNYDCIGISFFGLKNSAKVADNVLFNLGQGVQIWGGNNGPFACMATGITVKNNDLSNIWNYGINVLGDLAYSNSITNNTIQMLSPEQSNAIYSEGFNNEYKNNILGGYGWAAVCLSGWTDPDSGLSAFAHNEFFKDNSIAGFTPNPCHYALDFYTHDNTIIGLKPEQALYSDNGINNNFKRVYLYSPQSTPTHMSVSSSKVSNIIKKGGTKKVETL